MQASEGGGRRARVSALALALAARCAVASVSAPEEHPSGAILASYSFEADQPEPGPDTFTIFQAGSGSVRLTPEFHLSGFHGLEFRDVSGDGHFPELMGRLPEVTGGHVFFQFGLLTTDPAQAVNVALAGPRFFNRTEKNGLAFRFEVRDGQAFHYSDHERLAVGPIQAFVWYVVDLDYDVDRGRYDLRLWREGLEDPVVRLEGQPNAAAAPGSSVSLLSFVSDPFTDASDAVFYVDDVVLASTQAAVPDPFVAPGRRKLFLDLFAEYQKREHGRLRCVPATGPEDFALGRRDLGALAEVGDLGRVEALLAGREVDDPTSLPEDDPARARIEALGDWARGCAALARGEPEEALAAFGHAASLVPEARQYGLSSVLALAAAGRWHAADERLASIHADWRHDGRYPLVAAMLGVARGSLKLAEEWLRRPVEEALALDPDPLLGRLRAGGFDRDLIGALKQRYPAQWRRLLEQALVMEEYYYVLLWDERLRDARELAAQLGRRSEEALATDPVWFERAGDAAFLLGDRREAEQRYREALSRGGEEARLLLKLCDIAYLDGDLETERALRERYYGTLRPAS